MNLYKSIIEQFKKLNKFLLKKRKQEGRQNKEEHKIECFLFVLLELFCKIIQFNLIVYTKFVFVPVALFC